MSKYKVRLVDEGTLLNITVVRYIEAEDVEVADGTYRFVDGDGTVAVYEGGVVKSVRRVDE